MADQRISELTELTSLAAMDVIPVVDASDLTTKKVKWSTITPSFAPMDASQNVTVAGFITGKKCGAFASLLTHGVDTSITNNGVYVPIEGSFSNNPMHEFSLQVDPAIQYDGTLTQYFEIDWYATVAANINSTTLHFGVKKNGVLIDSSVMGIFCKTSGEMYFTAGTCVVSLATNDKIQLVVTSDKNSTLATVYHYTTTIKEFFD